MGTFLGIILLFGIIGGGIYLYYKVERLDREIARQKESALEQNQEEVR